MIDGWWMIAAAQGDRQCWCGRTRAQCWRRGAAASSRAATRAGLQAATGNVRRAGACSGRQASRGSSQRHITNHTSHITQLHVTWSARRHAAAARARDCAPCPDAASPARDACTRAARPVAPCGTLPGTARAAAWIVETNPCACPSHHRRAHQPPAVRPTGEQPVRPRVPAPARTSPSRTPADSHGLFPARRSPAYTASALTSSCSAIYSGCSRAPRTVPRPMRRAPQSHAGIVPPPAQPRVLAASSQARRDARHDTAPPRRPPCGPVPSRAPFQRTHVPLPPTCAPVFDPHDFSRAPPPDTPVASLHLRHGAARSTGPERPTCDRRLPPRLLAVQPGPAAAPPPPACAPTA